MGYPASADIHADVPPACRSSEQVTRGKLTPLHRAAGGCSPHFTGYPSNTCQTERETMKSLVRKTFSPEQILRMAMGTVTAGSTFVDVTIALLQGGDNMLAGMVFSVFVHYMLYLSVYLVGRWLVK